MLFQAKRQSSLPVSPRSSTGSLLPSKVPLQSSNSAGKTRRRVEKNALASSGIPQPTSYHNKAAVRKELEQQNATSTGSEVYVSQLKMVRSTLK